MDRQQVEEQVEIMTSSPGGAIRAGNCIAIFAMFLLQDLLIAQTVNPITNFNRIIALAQTIASLNSSIKDIQ
jgi:hypothetical protein